MNIKMSNKSFFLTSFTAAIGGTILFSQAAQASHQQGGFRNFREQHPDMNRHAARQMFRQLRHGVGGIGLPDPRPYPNIPEANPFQPGAPFCPDPLPQPRIHNGLREVKNQSLQFNDGRMVRLNSGVNLDLTSADRNITLGNNMFKDNESIQIHSGSETRTLTVGSQVSAAEYIAAKQVLAGGGQKVLVDAAGRATGGQVDLDAITQDNDVMRATNLVVAKDVTTYGDFGKRSDFRLLGDLTNFGTVHATSTSNSVKGGAIRADDINNYRGATISSNVDLTLDASGTFNNDGVVGSDAALTITAGGALNNSGLISAKGDVTIGSANMANRGLVTSVNNINLDGSNTAVLSVQNTGGTMAAVNGAINVRNAAYVGTYDSIVNGGDLFSKELNLNSGQGTTNVSVNALTGTVNGSGTAAHVLAQTTTLNLGDVCLTGDPTFYNTQGDINITGDILVAENLVFVAARNITSADNINIQAGNGTQGFDITFIAGADFDPIDGVDSPTVPPLTGNGGVSLSGKKSNVKPTVGPKFSGGFIDLGNNVNVIARAKSPSGASNGANIFMNAFAGKKGDGTGVIDISGAGLATGGTGTGKDASVFILGGASVGVAVRTGFIDTTGGADKSNGNIGLFTPKIVSSIKGQNITYDKNGNRGAAILTGKGFTKGGEILVTQVAGGVEINASNDVNIDCGGAIDIQGDVSAPADVQLFSLSGEIRDGATNAPIFGGNSISLTTSKANIGSFVNEVDIDTPNLSMFNSGQFAVVKVAGTGSLNIADTGSKGYVGIYALGRDVSSSNAINVGNIEIQANKFVSMADIFSKDQIRLTAGTGDLINDPFVGDVIGKSLTVFAVAGSVGENAGDLLFVDGFSQIQAAAGKDIFIFNGNKKGANFFNLNAIGNIFLRSDTSLSFDGPSVTSTGSIDIEIAAGTLNVGGDMDAVEAIRLVNNSDKGKLIFAAGAKVNTAGGSNGDIDIRVGPSTGLVFTPNNPNLTISKTGGVASFFGSGFKAKAPVNQLILTGADINIINGTKSGNSLSFDGGVVIEADPPVPEGTPTYLVSFEKDKPLSRMHDDTIFSALQNTNAALSTSSNPVTSSDVNLVPTDGTNQLLDNNRNGLHNQLLGAASLTRGDSYMLIEKPSSFEHDAVLWTELDVGMEKDGTSDSLKDGTHLVVASRNMTVETTFGTVQLPAGAVVLISAGSSHLSVYNLHDGSTSGINVVANGNRMSLLPGRHLCVSQNNANSFADINPIDAIPHRSVRKNETKNGATIFSSEFSVTSAASVVKPLRAILRSDQKEAKKIANQLLKTSAVLMHLGNGSTAYELHVKPKMVALR